MNSFGYSLGDPEADLSFDDRDSAAYAPLAWSSIPPSPGATTARRAPRGTRPSSTKCTSRGSPSCIPEVPEKLRGTYAGLASEAAIRASDRLGVTAVELLPVHHFLNDRHLVDRGLGNYWGYNTLAYFAPEQPLCRTRIAADAVQQFKMMVRGLHAAGIEVILDVVYNHTAEGNQLGPTLSLRGIDNAAYYRLSPEDRATTWISPAAATRSTCSTRACSSSSWTACATG